MTETEKNSDRDPKKDRRTYERLPLNTNVKFREVNLGSNFQHASFAEANIGGGGIFLPVNDPPPEGALIEMELDIPGLENPVELIGEVVWAHSEQTPVGMGIEFYRIKPEVRKHIIRNAQRGSWVEPEFTDPDKPGSVVC